jgi:hypothetical protein
MRLFRRRAVIGLLEAEGIFSKRSTGSLKERERNNMKMGDKERESIFIKL